MRDRQYALLVDAGYLYACSGRIVLATTTRRDFRVDTAGFVAALIETANVRVEGRLLRVYWFDAAKDRIPTLEQRAVAQLEGVKLRLGNLNHVGQQKGVDAQIRADLEALSRNGDGRYGFINTPEEAARGFAGQLAGALRVAASDVKVQVEFNPKRATAYRQVGYAKHQLKKEQFRDNTVDAAEIGAAESGNALYVVMIDPAVKDTEYELFGIVQKVMTPEELRAPETQEMFKKWQAAFAAGYNKLNLSPVGGGM